MQLTITEQREAQHAVLQVSGEVDIASAPVLRQHLLDTIDRGETLVAVDLSEVGFMDSTGLGVLVGGLKRIRQQDGNLVVVAPSGSVRKILEVTGLLDVFGVLDSRAELAGPS